jgi:hypothetical protein
LELTYLKYASAPRPTDAYAAAGPLSGTVPPSVIVVGVTPGVCRATQRAAATVRDHREIGFGAPASKAHGADREPCVVGHRLEVEQVADVLHGRRRPEREPQPGALLSRFASEISLNVIVQRLLAGGRHRAALAELPCVRP